METKLTLKLNKQVIDQAKKYAASHKRSLSKIIESYLNSLTDDSSNKKEEFEISPFVKSMSTGIQLPSDLDYKSEYAKNREEKYQ